MDDVQQADVDMVRTLDAHAVFLFLSLSSLFSSL